MIQAFQTAVSGLRASAQRLGIAAENIANSRTESYIPRTAAQTVEPEHGPRVALVPVSAINMANDPRAGIAGLVNMPGVNLAEELVETHSTVYAYKANLAVLSVAREMNGALLDRES